MSVNNSFSFMVKQRWRTDRCWLWKTVSLVVVICIRICISTQPELALSNNKSRLILIKTVTTGGSSRSSISQHHCGTARIPLSLCAMAIWFDWSIVRLDAICIPIKNRLPFPESIIKLQDTERYLPYFLYSSCAYLFLKRSVFYCCYKERNWWCEWCLAIGDRGWCRKWTVGDDAS